MPQALLFVRGLKSVSAVSLSAPEPRIAGAEKIGRIAGPEKNGTSRPRAGSVPRYLLGPLHDVERARAILQRLEKPYSLRLLSALLHAKRVFFELTLTLCANINT